jgi:hypothetical protein
MDMLIERHKKSFFTADKVVSEGLKKLGFGDKSTLFLASVKLKIDSHPSLNPKSQQCHPRLKEIPRFNQRWTLQ